MRDLSQHHSIKKSSLSIYKINIGLSALTALFGLVYLFSLSAQSSQGFTIKKISAQIDDLQTQNKKLQLQNSTLQSVTTLQQEAVNFDFVPVTSVSYLKEDNVALK